MMFMCSEEEDAADKLIPFIKQGRKQLMWEQEFRSGVVSQMRKEGATEMVI